MKTTNETKTGTKGVAMWTLLIALTAIGVGCNSTKDFQIQAGDEAAVDNAIAPEETPEEVAPAAQADVAATADPAVLPDNPETQETADSGAVEERHLDINQLEVNPVASKIAEEEIVAANARKVVAQPAQMGPVGIRVLSPSVKQEILQHYVDEIPTMQDRQVARNFLCPYGQHRNNNGDCSN